MRKLLIKIIGTAISFYITNALIQGFHISQQWQTYIIASVLFLLISIIIKPILKILFLPINLLTLGLFHWVINVIVLYIFDIIYEGVSIAAYHFSGYTSKLIEIPPTNLSLFWVLVISSFTISFFYSVYETVFSPNK